MWKFAIPAGCRQAAKISSVSAHMDENEVPLLRSAMHMQSDIPTRHTGSML
jgi:hypothetical protein